MLFAFLSCHSESPEECFLKWDKQADPIDLSNKCSERKSAFLSEDIARDSDLKWGWVGVGVKTERVGGLGTESAKAREY